MRLKHAARYSVLRALIRANQSVNFKNVCEDIEEKADMLQARWGDGWHEACVKVRNQRTNRVNKISISRDGFTAL